MTVSQEEFPPFALPHANQLLEDHPLWDAGLVATESGWFVCRSLRRAQNCSKMGSSGDKVGVRARRVLLLFGKLRGLPERWSIRARFTCRNSPY
jgi:hypothetical protein